MHIYRFVFGNQSKLVIYFFLLLVVVKVYVLLLDLGLSLSERFFRIFNHLIVRYLGVSLDFHGFALDLKIIRLMPQVFHVLDVE